MVDIQKVILRNPKGVSPNGILVGGSVRVRVHTDHRNLYVFGPLALRPNALRHVLAKSTKFGDTLVAFEITIEHIKGSKNVFANFLTRWVK